MAYIDTLTPKEQLVVQKAKVLIPEAFWKVGPTDDAQDEKLFLYAEMVVNDMNWWIPVTMYTVNSMPDRWIGIVLMGMAYFSQLFKQMEVTLQDFNYNDNGLTVNVDQTGKLSVAMVNILKAYGQQVEYMKKAEIFKVGSGLGTPRFQSQIGQFLKIALGSSFAWGSTSSS
jgi:hypothetical protein